MIKRSDLIDEGLQDNLLYQVEQAELFVRAHLHCPPYDSLEYLEKAKSCLEIAKRILRGESAIVISSEEMEELGLTDDESVV